MNRALDNGDIQFPRLLAEICATQDSLDIATLASEMDLTVEEVNGIFDRAQVRWEEIKADVWEGVSA
jgi:hypothetical protein